MDNEVRILSIRENAKAELQQLKTIEDGMVHLSKLEGIEAWVKAQKLDAEIHSLVLEQELRTKRIVGILYKQGQDTGEIASIKSGNIRGANQYKSAEAGEAATSVKTRSDFGLSKQQAEDFKKLASIPEEVFEEHIAEAKAEVETAVKKLTTTGAVKLAEQLNGKNDQVERIREVQKKAEIDERISELLQEINRWPKLYRMKIKQGIK